MNAVLGFAQLLELESLGQRQHESVEQILKAGRHLVQLVDEVLDLARIEAGQLRLSLEPVAVGEVIEESPALMAPEQLARLFEPFDRLDAEGSGTEGTGLGLALRVRRGPPGRGGGQLTGQTLLYIEDNLANLRLIERLPDVRLVPAMQGELGIELVREHRPTPSCWTCTCPTTYAYLAKPLDVREFLAVLDACLSAAGEERAQLRRT